MEVGRTGAPGLVGVEVDVDVAVVERVVVLVEEIWAFEEEVEGDVVVSWVFVKFNVVLLVILAGEDCDTVMVVTVVVGDPPTVMMIVLVCITVAVAVELGTPGIDMSAQEKLMFTLAPRHFATHIQYWHKQNPRCNIPLQYPTGSLPEIPNRRSTQSNLCHPGNNPPVPSQCP